MSIVDQFTPAPSYVVAGSGPYEVPHGYLDASELVVTVLQDDQRLVLTPAIDYWMTPDASFVQGDLYLSEAISVLREGWTLLIWRETKAEQGWAASQTAREQGLAGQHAREIMAIQDLRQRLDRAFRLSLDQPAAPAVLPEPEPHLAEDRLLIARPQPWQFFIGPRVDDLRGPEGPRGPRGVQGEVGPQGPRGFRGFQGVKGDPGNYLGLDLIGASDDIADRPATADNGDAWGLLEGDQIRIYVWLSSENAWYDAGPITAAGERPVANTLYVTVDGDDSNSGASLDTPLLTIERALELADAASEPGIIRIGPGVYETQGNLDVPDDWGVHAPHRSVTIVPAEGFEQRNVFRLGSGSFVEGPTFAGFEIDDLDNPTVGFAIAFRPGAVIRRVPYAHKIVAYRGQPPNLVAAPLDRDEGNPAIGNGMGVCIADGTQISAFSAFPNIMTWGATPSNPNGIGYVARNRALINAVNAVSLWCHKHHLCLGGGQIILSSCSTQFGDYSMWSEGYAQTLRIPKVAAYNADATAAGAIETAAATIIDDMWDALVAGSYTTGWTAEDEAFTRRDAAIFLDAVRYALIEGKQRAIDEFTRGLFQPDQDGTDPAICNLVPVFDAAKADAFAFSFNTMRNSINALSGMSGATQTAVTNLTARLNAVLDDPAFIRSPSLITAIGHTWTYPLTGVTRSAVPPVFGGSGKAQRISRSIRTRSGGRVRYSGQDDEGNAVFVGGLEINARTGQLGGRPFDTAVEARAIEAAIATGGY